MSSTLFESQLASAMSWTKSIPPGPESGAPLRLEGEGHETKRAQTKPPVAAESGDPVRRWDSAVEEA